MPSTFTQNIYPFILLHKTPFDCLLLFSLQLLSSRVCWFANTQSILVSSKLPKPTMIWHVYIIIHFFKVLPPFITLFLLHLYFIFTLLFLWIWRTESTFVFRGSNWIGVTHLSLWSSIQSGFMSYFGLFPYSYLSPWVIVTYTKIDERQHLDCRFQSFISSYSFYFYYLVLFLFYLGYHPNLSYFTL